MKGPEHYAEAEHLLSLAEDAGSERDYFVAVAQVHATLALVAATAPAAFTTQRGRRRSA